MPESFPPAAPPSGARLRSGSAARLAGVPVATLRVWERRYGVVAAPKTATGQRLYSGHDVQRLRLIKQLTDCGHAVGTIATLDLDELRALAGDEPRSAERRRVVVVGRAAAHKLQAAGCTPVAVHDEVDAAEQSGRALTADVLLVQLASLQPVLADRVLALADRLHAGLLIVLYAFGPETVAETLRAAGATVRREPASGRELARLVATAPRQSGDPTDAASADGPATDTRNFVVSPRRYGDEALSALSESPSAVGCECPRHVAEIIVQLAGFERYSDECGSRSPADAELHRKLNRVAGIARTLFEQALTALADSEGLVLPGSPAPAARRPAAPTAAPDADQDNI